MRVFRFILTLAVIAMITPGLSLAGDQEVAQQVINRLQAEREAGRLAGFSVDVRVEEGVVWMSGRVASSEQQALALTSAQHVPGVKQIVNDLAIAAPAAVANTPVPAESKSVLKGMGNAISSALFGSGEDGTVQQAQAQVPVSTPLNQSGYDGSAIGSGVASRAPQYMPQQAAPPSIPRMSYAPAPQQRAMPVGYSMAQPVNYQQGEFTGQPVPMHGGNGVGIAPARYDHPYMPNHSWPSYAAYPNYAAVTYPKQYSPTAWPYIGPFYPYPQVPLGWRKVTLEWDDGWWMLDFKDRRHR